jgi:hypothetical protein
MAILRDLAIAKCGRTWAYNHRSGMKTLRLMEAGRLG